MSSLQWPNTSTEKTAYDPATADYEVARIREDFPILKQVFYSQPLVYLDNAATTQKPQVVIDRTRIFYENEYGTVRRGVYALSEGSTQQFEGVRKQVSRFLNAEKSEEIIFVRGTTEAVNLVAYSYGHPFVHAGDEVIISAIEHHANIVPWQRLCEEKGALLRVIPVNDAGELILEEYEKLLSPKTRLVAVNHISNALGTINPIRQIIEKAHAVGAVVLIDGAQAAPHLPVDVQALDCDFYAFSGHKLYGPTGVGVLYAKMRHLEAMTPYQTGGEMIETVTFEKTTFTKPPAKFEAGTPAIAQVIGLGAALEYVQQLGLPWIRAHEDRLLAYATERLLQVEGLRIIGTAREKAGIVSFVLKDVHPHDIGTIVDRQGVAIRVGHHCAQPTMTRFNVPATARASFGLYNTMEEIDVLIQGIEKAKTIFG